MFEEQPGTCRAKSVQCETFNLRADDEDDDNDDSNEE